MGSCANVGLKDDVPSERKGETTLSLFSRASEILARKSHTRSASRGSLPRTRKSKETAREGFRSRLPYATNGIYLGGGKNKASYDTV